ncbi:ATP-binding protein [Mycolicibacterium novocastrense]|uniref:Adenylate/guanylate cyclase family protein n=1 Tax=Mycolicibacterium novocastrense TaxID=59813 RepID=A0ABQ0KUV8_MYCNV|nr:adenylate/guanylate cyclase domain-containing protein [Mycolicibacterium novocastrense]GAT12428.1 adenylate/guanylate cyclase family protein [Mycolicibacterium novocastrense]
MDAGRGPGGTATAADLHCAGCEAPLAATAKFCSECGAAVVQSARSAEYKHVTVLFADVVRSMDIAAALGAERLREIITDLVERCAAVIRRYDGTVDKFTGDGLMAVFGAPVALEDHAASACLAALGLQEEAERLAADVARRDGVELRLRVGLNSGRVITGDMGSGAFGYTAIGEQVGIAQRMEAVAAPGAVMLSESTARLVDGVAVLGEPERVRIKGAEEPVAAHRLISISRLHRPDRRDESPLVGRRWELAAAAGLLEGAIDGHGAVVGLVGPPGIGKSRLAREVAALADRRGIEVVRSFCESHTKQVPFHALAALLRTATGVERLDGASARARLRAALPDVDAEDVLLFEDLLGIGEPHAASATITPEARRRRLTAMVNTYCLARKIPAVYVIEDVHWMDEVSESMLADFLTVVPQTHLLTVITYRPEYQGILTRIRGGHTIALAPLRDADVCAIVDALLGAADSVGELRETIRERAAGNPLFAEEMVRELAERGVLDGEPGRFRNAADDAGVSVPATLQTTIAARIDRLDSKAKRTLCAGAVVGAEFGLDLVSALGVEPAVEDLLDAQLIEQIRFGSRPEFVFRNPLIRTVALESQLKSERAELHRRLAAAIEEGSPAGENAALIAEHLEAAGDLAAAYNWHLRAASWSVQRDIRGARAGWERAAKAADALPEGDPNRTALRIVPKTMLCMSTWRVGGGLADTGFEELRELCEGCGDYLSLAIGMYGQIALLSFQHRHREASTLASEQFELLQRCEGAVRALAYIHAGVMAKILAGEVREAHHIADWAAGLLEGYTGADMSGEQVSSALATALIWGSVAKCVLGEPDWLQSARRSATLEREVHPVGTLLVFIIGIGYSFGMHTKAIVADDRVLADTEEAVRKGREIGDVLALATACSALGLVLTSQPTEAERRRGLEALRESCDLYEGSSIFSPAVGARVRIAEIAAASGDLDDAIEDLRSIVNTLVRNEEKLFSVEAFAVLVESLLRRGGPDDIREAAEHIDRFADMATEPGVVVNEIQLLRMRARLARAQGDDSGFRDLVERYRALAVEFGFRGHIQLADAMPRS